MANQRSPEEVEDAEALPGIAFPSWGIVIESTVLIFKSFSIFKSSSRW